MQGPHLYDLHVAIDPDAYLGRTLDARYRVVKYIDQGGMGIVYEGVSLETGRSVAIKILIVEKDDQLYRRRFFNEAAMAASLTHRCAVRVLDYGVDGKDRTCFIIMELLEGSPLDRHLHEEGPICVEEALKLARDVTSVLIEAHASGFVHRDIKPSNLFVMNSPAGVWAKVLDFGLAKRVEPATDLTSRGTMLGSPKYMSPEQVHGSRVGPATDIYNLGLVIFRMLTNIDMFTGEVKSAVLVLQATAPPKTLADTAPHLGDQPALEWILETCLMKAPRARFASATELARALDIALEIEVGERPSCELKLVDGRVKIVRPVPEQPPKRVGPGVVGIGILLVVAAALLAMAIF